MNILSDTLKYAYNTSLNLALKTKVSPKVPAFYSPFSMPITRKLYSATGQSTISKVLLVASMILPLIALFELTIGNLGYLTMGNLLVFLKRKNVTPSYKWSSVKIGIGISAALLFFGVLLYTYKGSTAQWGKAEEQPIPEVKETLSEKGPSLFNYARMMIIVLCLWVAIENKCEGKSIRIPIRKT